MEERIQRILSEHYNLTIEKLTALEGGFCPDETYLLVTSDQMKYVVKYIQYHHSLQYLQSILKFSTLR